MSAPIDMDPAKASSSPAPAPNPAALALEPVAVAAVENAKLKPKIMQIFLEDRATQKMKIVVMRSNDRLWNLMDSVGADRIKYKTRLFAGEVELTEELGKTLLDAGIPDNSTVHYLLEPLFIAAPDAPAPPPEVELIPCEICHGSFPAAEFQQHAPCFRDAPPARQAAQPQRPANNNFNPASPAAPVAVEDAIPCERCGKAVAFLQYEMHINTCGFT